MNEEKLHYHQSTGNFIIILGDRGEVNGDSKKKSRAKSGPACINGIVSIKSACFLLCREVRRLWPENGEQQVSRDFVLMTSFPQRRITDMENSLASAGELK